MTPRLGTHRFVQPRKQPNKSRAGSAAGQTAAGTRYMRREEHSFQGKAPPVYKKMFWVQRRGGTKRNVVNSTSKSGFHRKRLQKKKRIVSSAEKVWLRKEQG